MSKETELDDGQAGNGKPALDPDGGVPGNTAATSDVEATADEVGPLAEALESSGSFEEDVSVEIAYEVLQLLSTQLYSSPLKAVEELVVNSWDADATECRVSVPDPSVLAERDPSTAIAVFDDGHGMTADELRSLWHVGSSHKREEAWEKRATRNQIGKFGIGKLASYAIARRVTYVTKAEGEPIRGVTIDFERFANATTGQGRPAPVTLRMLRVDDAKGLTSDARLGAIINELGVDAVKLSSEGNATWTLVVLENLKPKATEIKLGRLRWVLSTAMPAAADFKLYLNTDLVESSKLSGEFPVDFQVHELAPDRLASLLKETGEEWKVESDRLVSPSFPTGVTGRIRVADRSLYAAGGKSEDLGRSHGFFVKVRGRLVNETDPLFGAKPLSFTTFYNLLAEVEADDLDGFITAPRDDLVQVDEKVTFRALLLELFREARHRYEAVQEAEEQKQQSKHEESRTYVNSRLVERPVADVLVNESRQEEPVDWVLLDKEDDDEGLQRLIEGLYEEESERRKYSYKYVADGRQSALARFDPDKAQFWINEDHDLVIANYENPQARRLLEVVVTAEAMLEVYLREADVDPRVVTYVLSRRDQLLRSLSRDELYSLKAIATSIREATDSATALEIAVVGALRSLGFVSKHIGGSGTPDGEANFKVYGPANRTFTLEAKSSADVPSLNHIDFGGLRQHYEDKADEGAIGCLLVAPDYPGRDRGNDSQVAKRAITQKVSCWTTDDLARVVESAEARHITAEQVQKIVLGTFTPDDVAAKVEALLSEPGWSHKELSNAMLDTLEKMEGVLSNSPRTVDMLAVQIAMQPGFTGIEKDEIVRAADQMAKASKGMLHVTPEGTLHLPGAMDELRRRLDGVTGTAGAPRRRGTFREPSGSDAE